MIVTHKMKMDLVDKSGKSIIDVTQGDSVRVLELELLEQGAPWQIPGDLHVIVRYDKADGSNGCYDMLPDGTSAWEVRNNKLYITLAPALCGTKGYADMQITLVQGLEQVSTFVIGLDVDAEVVGGGEPEDYFNLSKWLSAFAREVLERESVYGVAVKCGFEGTEQEWLATLKGEKGDTGEQGIQGEKGEPGETPVFEKPYEGANYTLIKIGGEVVAVVYDGYSPIKGLDYHDGVTPRIGENGNWWLDDIDTGVKAGGVVSFDELTPEQKKSLKGDPGETPQFVVAGNSIVVTMGGEVIGTISTPEKGLDYWTDEDKAGIVADVIAQLPVYNGEVV